VAWLSRRFDAWTKHGILVEARRQNPSLDWGSPLLKALDHLYGELPDGLFFQLERVGEVETCLAGGDDQPACELSYTTPDDTRAGVRAKLLSVIPTESIVRAGWDEIAFEHGEKTYRLELPDPAMRISPRLAAAASIDEVLARFSGSPPSKPPPAARWYSRREEERAIPISSDLQNQDQPEPIHPDEPS
jgi:hypothetical protein